MKKCIIIPDSFKGTMSSLDVCEIMKNHILEFYPKCNAISIPIADGGEGTVDCFLHALSGEKVRLQVKGPFFNEIDSFYGVIGETAIIEMAAAAGLSLAEGHLNPCIASTYGVGQLATDAIKRGCKKIIFGLGGSCTNDGGAGMAAALGTKFFNIKGETFIPTGSTLDQVFKIDISDTEKLLNGIKMIAMCDIDNPMYGENGAAYVFAPQKGADTSTVTLLDKNLRHFANIIKESIGIDVGDIKGGGAAGAMGAGVHAFLGAELKQGIDIVLDMVSFEDELNDCDAVFTGEGKLDKQSLCGKAVVGISKKAKKKKIPVIAIVGTMEQGLEAIYDLGITQVYCTCNSPMPLEVLKKRSKSDLSKTMINALKSLELL